MNLEETIKRKVAKISSDYDLHHNYDIVISSEESITVHHGDYVDIRLEAGDPPRMIFPMFFVMRCFFSNPGEVKDPEKLFIDRVHRALSKYSRMRRTLINNIPRDRALILLDKEVKDKKKKDKWIKTTGLTDVVKPPIPKEDLEISYIVTVRDKVTGMSFSMPGDNVEIARAGAIHRLTNIVFANEEIEEFRGLAKRLAEPVPGIDSSPKPDVINIVTQVIKKEEVLLEQVSERSEYNDKQN